MDPTSSAERPRVAFAALRFFEERTGNVESLLNLMTGLRSLGVPARLLVPHSSALSCAFEGFALETYAEHSLVRADILAVERALVRASAGLRSKVDLIQLQLPSPAFARVAERVKRASGLPVLASFESSYHVAPAVAWPSSPRTALNLLLRRALNARVHARFTRFAFDGCIVASEYQRRELAALGCPAPVHVIPNCTVFERFAQVDPATSAPDLLRPGRRTLAYIGHFNFIKGVPYLLAAFEHLVARRSEVDLLLVGSGRGNQSREVKNGVRALGERASLCERTIDVAALLPRLDALVLPYVASFGHQLFPNLVLEGLAAGVPLVCTDLPPVNEIVREGETGYLARAGDAQGLAAAIERALDGGAARQAMQARQQALCRERFDRSVVAERHLELYKKLLHG